MIKINTAWFAVLLLAACQPSTQASSATPNGAATETPREQAVSAPIPIEDKDMDNQDAFETTAEKMVAHKGAVVEIKSSISAANAVAVVINYRRGATESGVELPATCPVTIIEKGVGAPAMVAANDHLLECGLLLFAGAVDVAVRVSDDKILIAHQGDKKNAVFDLKRDTDGTWILGKAVFTRSVSNLETEQVDVVSDEFIYSQASRKIHFADYRYTMIKDYLVTRVIE